MVFAFSDTTVEAATIMQDQLLKQSMRAGRRACQAQLGAFLVGVVLVIGGCGGTGLMRDGEVAELAVSHDHLMTKDSIRVQLQGVSIPDPFYLSEVEGQGIRKEVRIIARDWKGSVIRVPIYPVFWQREPDYLRTYVDPVVEEAQKEGLYVILAWQAQGNPAEPGGYTPSWAQADVWGAQPVNPNPNLAASALAQIAYRYRSATNVLYSVFSEPARVSWEAWRPVAERLISTVRANDPDAVTLVPGIDWGSDLSGAISKPIRRSNVVYEAHTYPHHGKDWTAVTDSLQGQAPVIIGEFGFLQKHVAESFELRSYGQELIREAERPHVVGWIAWVWHHSWRPSLLTSFESRQPTSYGQFIKTALTGDSHTTR